MAKYSPIILDIESSGFGSHSYPIEIGVIFEDKSKYCSLIKPESNWVHWSEEAEQLHHIKRDSLTIHGKSAYDVAKRLNKLLHGKIVYSDGWVVDSTWLIRLFEAAKIEMTFSLSAIEMILKEQQMNLWDEMKKKVISELKLSRHRASNDAQIIQETFTRTLCVNQSPSH
ncbi:hypothetical protein ACPUVO_12845 [Pseudocolwellia sp. HL-MZ19]|uniref:3'-5' exonuclease n=1 Tax=unclassified Pseudocolwellia TaxID=2848178 RepID=UPI003CE9120F